MRPLPLLIFLSTLSLRRATIGSVQLALKMMIFLSTLSLRRATRVLEVTRNAHTDFYPRSPCGERQYLVRGQRPSWEISIHALLAESDRNTKNNYTDYCDFYPRSPCGERQLYVNRTAKAVVFLSTLSLRRATAKVHKTVGHFCAYETNFMGIASSC